MISMLHRVHWRQHVALDVGTATTRIAVGQSSFVEHPSCLDGKQALRGGVIVDPGIILDVLKPLLQRARMCGIIRPCVLACAPSDAQRYERRLLFDSIMRAGAASVFLIPEPLAAAIGSGLDVSSPYSQMVIDIGEGVTDCAIIRSSKIYATCAIRVGCSQMCQAVTKAVGGQEHAGLNESYADMLMRTCGLLRCHDKPGSDLVATALLPVVERIADTVDGFLRDLTHEVGCEVIDSGICLTGGGALITGMREFFEQRTGICVTVANAPRASVVEGARTILPVTLLLNQLK